MFAFPQLITRTCTRCALYMYDDTPGEMGPPTMLESGEQMKRPEGCDPPCHQCPKVPADAPARTREHAIDPTDKSYEAVRFYQRCRAINRFPEDEIVERCAGMIEPIERAAEIMKTKDAAGAIALLLASGGRRG